MLFLSTDFSKQLIKKWIMTIYRKIKQFSKCHYFYMKIGCRFDFIISAKWHLLPTFILVIFNNKELQEEVTDLLDIIPADTITLFSNRLRTCWSDYNEALASEEAFSQQEIDRATNALMRCICRELNRVYRLNGNVLPNEQWKQWWDTYSCQTNSTS